MKKLIKRLPVLAILTLLKLTAFGQIDTPQIHLPQYRYIEDSITYSVFTFEAEKEFQYMYILIDTLMSERVYLRNSLNTCSETIEYADSVMSISNEQIKTLTRKSVVQDSLLDKTEEQVEIISTELDETRKNLKYSLSANALLILLLILL